MPFSPILACLNVARSMEYYTNKLGFQLAWQMPPNENGDITFACVKLGDAEILLGVTEGFVQPEDRDKRGIGIQLYINLPDSVNIDAVYAHANASGATITQALQTRDWGERVFTVNDLDGYNLMVAQQIRAKE
ncbi:MAG: VOC family protein [Anaerolineaceae bacterium]|nr:VOC family protein [Anaerolineaceae bacterium]